MTASGFVTTGSSELSPRTGPPVQGQAGVASAATYTTEGALLVH